METLVAIVLRFNVPPQLIVASAISVTAYLALLGSLLTFRSIANGLHASCEASSSVVDVWNLNPFGEVNTRKLPDRLGDHEQS